MPSEANRRYLAVFALLFPLLFYIAALNPYLLPEQYDNVLYYFGARSLAETGSFKWEGFYIRNWAPGLPAAMAVPFALGYNSVVVGKIIVLFSVALSLFLGYRLFQREGRPYGLPVFLFAGLLPAGFLMGTRIMSEWPYTALSLGFLLLLTRMRKDRRLSLAALTGVLLGAASLTRWVGVFLGLAIIAQAVPHLWRRRFRAVLPEAFAAAVGAFLWGLWKAKLAWQVHMGTASRNWYFDESNFLAHFSIPALWESLGDLFFQSRSLLGAAGLQDHPIALLLIVPAAVTVLGMILHFRRAGQPSDWYALAVLLLFLCFRWKNTRYLVPIAPFLLFYLFTGVTRLAGWVRTPLWRTRLAGVALAGWAVALMMLNGYLLIFGNNNNHRGLNLAASPTAESFYTGRWKNLYQVCQDIRKSAPAGPVALKGEESKYIFAFSGVRCVPYVPGRPATFVIVEAPEKIEDTTGLEEIRRGPAFALYRGTQTQGKDIHITQMENPP